MFVEASERLSILAISYSYMDGNKNSSAYCPLRDIIITIIIIIIIVIIIIIIISIIIVIVIVIVIVFVVVVIVMVMVIVIVIIILHACDNTNFNAFRNYPHQYNCKRSF